MPLKRLIVVYESEETCERRLTELSPEAAKDVACYLAQATDLQAYREPISEAFGNKVVEVRFFDLAEGEEITKCLAESPRSTMLWTLTDGFRYYRGSYLSSLAKLLEVRIFGSLPQAQLSCQDKFRCVSLAQSVGLNVPPTALMRGGELLTPSIDSKTYFVKPNTLGAKIGIFGDSKTDDWDTVVELSKRVESLYGDDVLIQAFIPGFDVRVSYMNLGEGKRPGVYRLTGAEAGEVGGEFLTMKDNWTLSALSDKPKAFQPRMLPLGIASLREQILGQVDSLVAVAGLKDYFSFDFRVTPEGEAYFLEFEVCPAVTIHDFRAYLAEVHGLELPEALVKAIGHSWSRDSL